MFFLQKREAFFCFLPSNKQWRKWVFRLIPSFHLYENKVGYVCRILLHGKWITFWNEMHIRLSKEKTLIHKSIFANSILQIEKFSGKTTYFENESLLNIHACFFPAFVCPLKCNNWAHYFLWNVSSKVTVRWSRKKLFGFLPPPCSTTSKNVTIIGIYRGQHTKSIFVFLFELLPLFSMFQSKQMRSLRHGQISSNQGESL